MIYPLIFHQIETELFLFPWKIDTLKDSSLIVSRDIYGLAIKYKNKSYILTTAHDINHTAKFRYKNNILTILFLNKDLDICILENSCQCDYTENLEYLLNYEKGNIFINSSTFTNKIVVIFDDIIETNMTMLGPLSLIINCHTHVDSIEIKQGMSGIALINNNNNYIGLISRKSNENIHIIPLINYLCIINNNNLCYYYEFLTIEDNNLKIINKSNKYYHTKKLKSDCFKKNDIIIKVNNIYIDNGYIYDKKLKIKVSIYIYILLNHKDKDRVDFLIERNNIVMKMKIYVNSYKKLECIKDDNITLYDKSKTDISYRFNTNILMYYLINNLEIINTIPTNIFENIKYNKYICMKDLI